MADTFMSDELDLDLESNLETEEDKQRNRELKRNKDLSDKLKAEAEARQKAEKDKADALKEAEFYKKFNSLTSKYQGAGEFQDQIKERVMKGYDEEEAVLAVLAKEGKYTPPTPPPPPPAPKESPAGGSAANTIPSSGEKNLEEMNRTEKKALVEEALNKGDISFKNY